MDIEDLKSFELFQEILDTLLLLAGFIQKINSGLLIKDTFVINQNETVILEAEKSDGDAKNVINWIEDTIFDLKQKIVACDKLTNENYEKFKSENPEIKDEVRLRIKDLKKTKKFLDELVLEPISYNLFKNLNTGPDITADYAGITVKETKYYII